MTSFDLKNVALPQEVKKAGKAEGVYQAGSLDPFDIDIKTIEVQPELPTTGLVTSQSLCTPGCGNTGTGNSFCC